MKKWLKKISFSWIFLAIVVLIYLALLFYNPDLFFGALGFSLDILIKILPFFVLAFVLLVIAGYFITTQYLLRHLQGGKIKKWVYVIIGGIFSSGPIYMWYPLLADLREKGLNPGLIACFLYNKAIKLPLMPLLVLYFGVAYTITLSLVMILFSIIQGILINKLMPLSYENSNRFRRGER